MTRFLPPPGLPRQLSTQTLVYSIGAGTFISANAVFFTRVVGLSAGQVGIGMSVAALVSFLLAVPSGTVIDRVGSREVWILAVIAEGIMYLSYPFAKGFGAFLCVVIALALVETAGNTARGAYTLQAVPRELRVTTLAYARSFANVGYTLGAGLAGLALAVDQLWAYYGLAFINAGVLLGNAVFVYRMPRANSLQRRSDERGKLFAVLRDRPFLSVSALCGALQAHITLLSLVVPLWLVSHTDAPKIVLAGLVVLNTIAVIFLQVPFSRGSEHADGAARALRRAGLAMGVGCCILALSGWSRGWVTIGVLIVGFMAITFGELLQSSGQWGLSTELPPADRKAEYLGAMRLGIQGQRVVGPALLTGLIMTWVGYGWIVAGAIFVVLGIACVPVVAWAARQAKNPHVGPAPKGSDNGQFVGRPPS